MPTMGDVFRRYGLDYLRRFGKGILPSHRRAIRDLTACRTSALGGHLVRCTECGHQRYAYHSCRSRTCPTCHGNDTERWLEKRRKELFPVLYFHVVFTLPKSLHEIVRSHQKILYSCLMRAAAQALMTLARDPKFLGGSIGLLGVLHTWTQAMGLHPHAHFLVPGGALSPDGRTWLPARKNYLVPFKALSSIFRAKFMALARKALPQITFPQDIWEKDWVVFAKPSVQGADKVLAYLARYVHRIAITNNRILSIDEGQVTFRYKDSREQRWKTMTLPALEFLRRFLQHVLPRGFHKIRYYGLFSPSNRPLLRVVCDLLEEQEETKEKSVKEDGSDQDDKPWLRNVPRCPQCIRGFMIAVAWISPQGRAPPCH